jgi:hypothetical protein
LIPRRIRGIRVWDSRSRDLGFGIGDLGFGIS